MGQAEYKFERFIEPEFPIYTSVQSGRPVLVKNHYHQAAEVLQVMEGKVQALIGITYKEYKKGDIIFIPPSVVHEVNSLTEDAVIRGITYEFSLISIEGLHLDFDSLFHGQQRMEYVITSDIEEYEKICSHVDKIFALYGKFNISNKVQLVSYLMLILTKVIQLYGLEESTQDKNYQKLSPVLNYVEKHYAEKIQIAQLSKIIHVCDDRLIRLFKEVTGETPVEYLTNMRIEASMKLLSTTDLSVAEIAEKTGFGSDTYMTRVFKQKLNTTPGKYRQR